MPHITLNSDGQPHLLLNIFAIFVLILNAMHVSTANTVFACMLFFWSRVAYVIIYAAGIPVLRTLAFVAGFIAQVQLALAILGLT